MVCLANRDAHWIGFWIATIQGNSRKRRLISTDRKTESPFGRSAKVLFDCLGRLPRDVIICSHVDGSCQVQSPGRSSAWPLVPWPSLLRSQQLFSCICKRSEGHRRCLWTQSWFIARWYVTRFLK